MIIGTIVDLIGTRMLIELADEILYIVAELFSKSLSSGDIPQEWEIGQHYIHFQERKENKYSKL